MKDDTTGSLLLVDDEPNLLRVLGAQLRKSGYEVAEAVTTEEALEAVRCANFDVMLSDLTMPGMSGIELLRTAQELDPQLVGIVMTGRGSVSVAVEAMKQGAFDFIVKPIEQVTLRQALSRALEVRRLRRENIQLQDVVALHELGKALAAEHDRAVVFEKVATAALKQCAADECSIMLPGPTGESLVVVFARGREEIVGSPAMTEGIATWVAQHREPVVLRGAVADQRFASANPREEISSAVSMPLLSGGGLVGVLNVNAIRRRRPFTHGEVKALGVLASIAAPAIEAAGLQAQLAESEATYKTVVETSPDGIVLVDREGRVKKANRQAARLTGRDEPDALTGMSILDLIAPESRERVIQDFEEGRDTVTSVPYVGVRKDGTRYHMELSASHVGDRTKAGEIVAVVRDCTQRVLAEHALRESEGKLRASESHYRQLFESTKDAIMVLDSASGELLDVNPSMVALLGRDRSELIGQKIWECAPLRSIAGSADQFAELRARTGVAEEFRIQAREGRVAAIEVVSNVFRVGDADVVQCSVRDVTERRAAEDALRESKVFLENVLENIPNVIAVKNARDLRFVRVNRAGERLLQRTRQEIVGKTAHDVLSPHAAEECTRGDREALESRRSTYTAVEAVELQPGGQRLLRTMRIPILADDGTPLYLLRISEDVTDQLRSEELRVAKEAAEAANRAKSLFLANMSHEIRTPLNAILGFAQLMLVDDTISARQRESLETINRAGEHLLALINDILEMSKIEAGRSELLPISFNLRSLVDDLARMFQARTRGKGLVLDVEVGGEVPRGITADEGKLRQIFINLLGNAIKFTERGRVSWRLHAERADGPAVQIVARIEDTGPGIAPAAMSRLFAPFVQVAAGLKTTGGTGLGLAISREFARAMGGDITVESEGGKGSCFTVRVVVQETDLANAPAGSPRAVTRLKPGTGPYRILVVDDNDENRALMVTMLRAAGFEAREAETGIVALAAFEEWRPHAVLMDQQMPQMNGGEATRRIRATDAGRTVPVIAVSANAFEDDKAAALANGADDFLSKPFRARDLFEILRARLGLEYVAAQSPPAATTAVEAAVGKALYRAVLSVMPAQFTTDLTTAIIDADYDRILQLVEQVALRDVSVAQGLRERVERFEYQAVLELLGGEATP